MPTAILERKVQTSIAYPECQGPPPGWMGLPVVRLTGTSARCRQQPWPLMPKVVLAKVKEALPTFGFSLKVYAPDNTRPPNSASNSCFAPARNPLTGQRGDPLVIGEKDGKFYLIAAWE